MPGISIRLGVQFRRVLGFTVNFTSPAPGTVFVVGVATSASITSTIDGNYELSFDSDFSNIRGNITVTGGTGSGNVTADAADVGKLVLYVREVGGSAALDSLACTVFGAPSLLAIPELVEWWPTYSGYGSVTTSNAALANLSPWSESNITHDNNGGAGYPDPDGGTGAWRLTETSDGGVATYHTLTGAVTNAGGFYFDFTIWLKPEVGGRTCYLVGANTYGMLGMVDADTGAIGPIHNATVTDLGAAAGGRWFRFALRAGYATAPSSLYIQSAVGIDFGSGDQHYAGDGRVCGDVYLPPTTGINGLTQTRVQTIAGQKSVADLTQSTAANQMFFWEEIVGGIVVPHVGVGRACYATTTNATVLASLGGDDPPFAILGVCRLAHAGSGPLQMYGSGSSCFDLPLYSNGTNLCTRRYDGSIGGEVSFGVAESALATHQTFALIRHADRSCDLWIGGVYKSTVNLADLSACAFTAAYHSFISGTAADTSVADLAIFTGDITYEYLQPALQYMAAPYGLTA